MPQAEPHAPSGDEAPDVKTRAAQALDQLRALSATELQSSEPLIEELAGSVRDPQFRARLNAYRAIIEHDRDGRAVGHSKSATEATLEMNELMGFSRRYDVGKDVLGQYMERWPVAGNLRKQGVVLSGYSEEATPFTDVFAKDVQIVRHADAKATVLVFCGIRHLFGFSLNLLHHCWLGAQPANIIYLRDHHATLYLQGLASVGDQTASLAYLRGAVAALGATKLVAIGNSGGVLGALHYGSLLNADCILGYSGPSSVEIGLQFEAKQSFRKLAKLQSHGKVTWPNIRQALEQRPDTQVRMFYAGDHEADRPQAENLAGLANVSLEPVAGETEHFIIDKLIESGDFGSSLTDAINTPPTPGAVTAREQAFEAPIAVAPALPSPQDPSLQDEAAAEDGPAPVRPAVSTPVVKAAVSLSAERDTPRPAIKLGKKARERAALAASAAANPPSLVAKPPRNAKGHEASRRAEERHAGQKPDVVVVGDSRAAMWPKSFTSTFGESVANIAIPGSTVPVMAWKLNNTAVDLSSASIAVVIAGVNDLRMSEAPAEAIADSIAELASAIRLKAPAAAVHVFEVFAAKTERHYTEEKRLAVNRRLHDLAAQGRFKLLRAELDDSADETLFKDDGLHLRTRAYRKLARIVGETLAKGRGKDARAPEASAGMDAPSQPKPKPGKRPQGRAVTK